MRFAGSIGLNVPEIALVSFSGVSAAMFMLSRIEMRACRGRIRCGATLGRSGMSSETLLPAPQRRSGAPAKREGSTVM